MSQELQQEQSQPERKRGKLSLEDEKFIRENCESMTIEQIANSLNRTVEPIERYIKAKKLNFIEDVPATIEESYLRKKLHGRSYWQEVKKQLGADRDELKYFEAMWCELMEQFQENVTATEEIQIKQWVILEILMNRSMKERRKIVEEISNIESILAIETSKPVELQDKNIVIALQQQLSFARNAMGSFTREHTTLLKETNEISKSLKGTRDQRLKKVEDGKTNFVSLIQMLDDQKIKEKEGRDMELMRLAAKKVKEKLSDYHTYGDGVVDQPFLNYETFHSDDTNEQKDKD